MSCIKRDMKHLEICMIAADWYKQCKGFPYNVKETMGILKEDFNSLMKEQNALVLSQMCDDKDEIILCRAVVKAYTKRILKHLESLLSHMQVAEAFEAVAKIKKSLKKGDYSKASGCCLNLLRVVLATLSKLQGVLEDLEDEGLLDN